MTISSAHIVVESRKGRGEDRLSIRRVLHGLTVLVADGAGGCAGGAAAAQRLCVTHLGPADDWVAWLVDQDRDLVPVGMAAAVVLTVFDDGRIVGASVGDCEAWLVGVKGPDIELTQQQCRKPLLGSGQARPIRLDGHLDGRRLVVGTDGLWKYMAHGHLCPLARGPLEQVPYTLTRHVRLPNGALQDDVAIVACEAA